MNALAYLLRALVAKKKSFIALAPGKKIRLIEVLETLGMYNKTFYRMLKVSQISFPRNFLPGVNDIKLFCRCH
jgi:predicted DNA-binding transcriptional regulator AlpA